ncbi:TetR/AcrR family transcriptional regulator [Nocardiopsis halophila]|uniref:TetR/AcrR family transcriptional regulator n=1 Tax=Nocardiopsis halophila TaxID=141692 RepID=UPI00034D2EF1|nr:TetR/AcrR family transcriptional regulator [Nocardiopsis halophila]
MSPRRVDRAARREHILAVAVRLFAERGFSATRIEDVAAAAGIAKGSVYLYFESRDALLVGAFDRLGERSARVLRLARDPGRTAAERLEELVRGALTMLADEPDLTRVMVDLWAAGRHGGGTAPPTLDMAKVYGEYRRVIADLLRQAAAEGDARPGAGEAEAAVVVGAVEGCLVQWLMDPEVDLVALADTVVGVCLRGVLRHASPSGAQGTGDGRGSGTA